MCKREKGTKTLTVTATMLESDSEEEALFHSYSVDGFEREREREVSLFIKGPSLSTVEERTLCLVEMIYQREREI